MSAIQEAVKRAEASAASTQVDAVEERLSLSSVAPSGSWNWLPNIILFVLLAVALWNYLSEREFRRQMEARLETTISDLESARSDFRLVERRNHEMEDLLHAELEASNGRIAKMKFDLELLHAERDSADTALAASRQYTATLQSQNRKLHEVIQNLRNRGNPALATSGSMVWDHTASTSTDHST